MTFCSIKLLIFYLCYSHLKLKVYECTISGLVASSPGMTFQSVPIQAAQGPMQAGVQPGFQYPGIEENLKIRKY
jgi:hypothetical protein